MKTLKNQKKRKLLNRAYFNNVVLFLFILLLPTQLGKHFFFDFSYLSGVRVDYLAPTLYITDALALLLFITNIRSVADVLKQKKILILLALLFLNILISQFQPISIYRYIKIVELLGIYVIFSKQRLSKNLLLIGFFIGSLFELLLAVPQFVNKHSLQGIFYFFGERPLSLSMPGIAKAAIQGVEFLRPYGTFSHPNSLAGFYLLLYFFMLTKKFRSSIIKKLFLFICTCLVFISFSKLSIFIFLILNFIYLWKNKKTIACTFCVISRFIILFFVALIFLNAQTDPLTLQKRYLLFNNAIQIIQKNFLFGTGIGTYLVVQNQYSSKFLDILYQPVHNIFLLFISEVGILFSLIIGLTCLKPIKLFISKAPYIFAVFFITGLFDHYWLTLQQNFLLLGVVIGLINSPLFSSSRRST